MYSFMNDYSEGAHPKVLELLTRTNYEQNKGYGEDVHSEKAKALIRALIKNDEADIHFIPGGTITNLLVISALLRPHQCVISPETGHINVHEAGAVEATGHKVLALPSLDGKLTPESIQRALDFHNDEHMVKPGMVYISNPTELGTIYSLGELRTISNICRRANLILFLDGARMGSALTAESNDLTLEDIRKLTDIFYIGGTKNGALLGEALVITAKELMEDFRYLIKQRGALMAKGFVIGIQFEALFEDGLYFRLADHANKMAKRIRDALKNYGYSFYAQPCTNQLFPILPVPMVEKLSKEFGFYIQGKTREGEAIIRLVTSWATTEGGVESFIGFLAEYAETSPKA